MRTRIWPFVSGSFCILLLLVPLFGWIVSRKAAGIETQAKQAREAYSRADAAITEIRGEVYRTALLFREPVTDAERFSIREEMQKIHERTESDINKLEGLLGRSEHEQLTSLRDELHSYWKAADESFDPAAPGERETRTFLLRRNSQRETVLELAGQIDDLNTANLRIAEEQIDAQQHSLWNFAAGSVSLLLLLGILVAIASIFYLARIENLSEKERQRAEDAERELRRLSNQLVRAQEDERKLISRELHDEVGQILTGLRMELGGLWRGEPDHGFSERLNSIKTLAEDALRSVRNLSLLLRPSMLDDLGLAPALRWQTKEFSRRTGIEVSSEIRGTLTDLPEPVRICLYRAVQEALTNCARHSQATHVTVTIEQGDHQITASVHDNGKGFERGTLRTQGLGLVGMEERVRALNGKLNLLSTPGSGTTIAIQLPLSADAPATAPNLSQAESVQL